MTLEASAVAPPSCCLMILNYNGQELLAECLPSALVAAAALGRPCPVVVVDNRSPAGDYEFLRREYPMVEAVLAEANDYLFSLNPVVAARPEDVVVILNNDMTFDPGFIAPLLAHFVNPAVFAVTARVFDWDRTTVITARSRLVRGRFWYSLNRTFDDVEPCYTLYAAGGAAAFRRTAFVELGGFDPLFRPAYYEEVDLSYRAWTRGWTVVFEPASVMIHRRAATLGKQHGKDGLRRMILRNQVLFNVKDAGTWPELFVFLLLLPLRTLRAAIQGDRLTAGALLESLRRLPMALAGRLRERVGRHVSDREISATIDHGRVPARAAEAPTGVAEAG